MSNTSAETARNENLRPLAGRSWTTTRAYGESMDLEEAVKTIARYLSTNGISMMFITPISAVPLKVCGERIRNLEPHEVIITKIAGEHGIKVSDLFAKTRQQHIVRARQIAMLELHRFGWSKSRIARYFNMNHTTVLHAIQQRTKSNKR